MGPGGTGQTVWANSAVKKLSNGQLVLCTAEIRLGEMYKITLNTQIPVLPSLDSSQHVTVCTNAGHLVFFHWWYLGVYWMDALFAAKQISGSTST
jgi:hypothetical protein